MPAVRSRLLGRGQIGYDQRDGTKHRREDLVEDDRLRGLLVHRDNIDPAHPQDVLYPIGPDGVRHRRRPAPPIDRENKVVGIGYLWDPKTGKHLHLPVIGISVANQGLVVTVKRVEPTSSAVTLSDVIQVATGLGIGISTSNTTITISDNLSSRQWAWTIGDSIAGMSVSDSYTADREIGGQATGDAIAVSPTFTTDREVNTSGSNSDIAVSSAFSASLAYGAYGASDGVAVSPTFVADKILFFEDPDDGPVILLGTPQGTWGVAYPFGADTYGSHKFGGVADEGDF